MKNEIPTIWKDLAAASTPEQLHVATLRWAMREWYTRELVWIVLPSVDLRDRIPFSVCSTPLRAFRFLARSYPSGEVAGRLRIWLYDERPSLEGLHRLGLQEGRQVLLYPKGIHHPGIYIPGGTGPSQEVDFGAAAMVDTLQLVACPAYMDQFQVLALRGLNPVEITGFPKKVSGEAISFKGQPLL